MHKKEITQETFRQDSTLYISTSSTVGYSSDIHYKKQIRSYSLLDKDKTFFSLGHLNIFFLGHLNILLSSCR